MIIGELFHPELDHWLEEKVGFEFFQEDEIHPKIFFIDLIEELNKNHPFIVTVAGTNGKGETCLCLEDLFRVHGLSTGLFTSPHILSPVERFRFNGKQISSDLLFKTFERNESKTEFLSYYEFLFYCFLDIALKERPKVLILEVGLGGRRDAVNFLDADMTGLTSISHDHTEILGNCLKGILREKLGITRPRVPLVSTLKEETLISLAQFFCRDQKVPFYQLDIEDKASFKQRNKTLAEKIFQMSCEKLQVKTSFFKTPIEKISFGRGQEMTSPCGRLMLLGSHNIDGLKEMMRWVVNSASLPENKSKFAGVIAGFSRKSSEDLEDCLNVIFETPHLAECYYFCSFEHIKATPEKLLEKTISKIVENYEQQKTIFYYREIATAIDKIGIFPEKRYLVTGSYYFLGAFLRSLLLRFPQLTLS